MNYTDTIYEAVCLLDELIRSYAAPVQFTPLFLTERIGGSPGTIGRVQAQIVSALRSKGHNVRYFRRKFCFDAPLRLPGFEDTPAVEPRDCALGAVQARESRGHGASASA